MTENRDLAVNGHDPPVLCAKCHKDIGLGRPTSSPSHVSINSAASYPLQTTSTSPITHTDIRPQPTPDTSGPPTWRDRHLSLKLKIGRILESKRTHQILLILIVIDAAFVLTELFYVVLNPTCPPSEKDELPRWLEDLAHATLAIDCLFVLEIPAALYAFGLRYYGLSWRKPAVQHAYLHLFDAVVILGTVILETALKGKEQELAGLLVVLRMWRVVKVVGGVAVGVGEWDENKAETVKQAKLQVKALRKENEGLRRRLERVGEEV